MAQTIDLMGASYPDVPAVNLPKHGGGTAKFTDVTDTTAAASDVAQCKYFYTADGTRTEGTSSGGGAAVVVTDTTDPVTGGTIKTITAVDISGDTVDAAHLLTGYTAHDRTGQAITGSYAPAPAPTGTISITANATGIDVSSYATADVAVPTGISCPPGYAYYNGLLLPEIPTVDGFPYIWMRTNDDAGVINVVFGKTQWRTKSSATLDNWQLETAALTTDGAWYYAIADDGTEDEWRDLTYTKNYFGLGTSSGRKVFWTSHDIKISTTANIIMRACPVIGPPSS